MIGIPKIYLAFLNECICLQLGAGDVSSFLLGLGLTRYGYEWLHISRLTVFCFFKKDILDQQGNPAVVMFVAEQYWTFRRNMGKSQQYNCVSIITSDYMPQNSQMLNRWNKVACSCSKSHTLARSIATIVYFT